MSCTTVFIAVQCFQCSTMQVKQRKKSSNKWNCVVCNEKQSVRKVFSQGSMAKDVRKFVQTFNMSRQFHEQQQDDETLAQQLTEIQLTKRRTDWTEYIDDLDFNAHDDDDQREELCDEANVVTEMPKPLFKKPKLINTTYSSAAADDEKLRRPVFRKRNKFNNNPVKQIAKGGTVGDNHDTVDQGISNSTMKRSSKLNACDGDDTASRSVMVKLKRPVSKWDNFIDDDDDNDESGYEEINAVAFETKIAKGGRVSDNHDTVDHGISNSTMKRILKLNACDGDDTGSSSVMVKLKRPVSKWDNFIDDDDDDESGYEEINAVAFETKVSDEIVEDDVYPDFL